MPKLSKTRLNERITCRVKLLGDGVNLTLMRERDGAILVYRLPYDFDVVTEDRKESLDEQDSE